MWFVHFLRVMMNLLHFCSVTNWKRTDKKYRIWGQVYITFILAGHLHNYIIQ